MQTDRVILVPGPEEEIKNVEFIYKSFVNDGLQESQIATLLNQRGIKTDLGRNWSRATVHQVLTNEKYIGNNVFNRISFKLKKQRVVNSPDMWIRADGVFEGIVEASLFYTVQGMIRERGRKFTNEELLEKTKISTGKAWMVIRDDHGGKGRDAIQRRLQPQVWQLTEGLGVGRFDPERDYSYIEINKKLRKFHAETIKNVIAEVAELGGYVTQNLENDLLILNDELRISLIICRCHQLKSGSYRWKFHFDTGLSPDLTIAIRMDVNNEKPLDYYLLPLLDIDDPNIRFRENNALNLEMYRFESLEGFFMMAERVKIPEAA